MSDIDVKCGTGLHVVMHGVKGSEINKYGTREAMARNSTAPLRLLEDCTVKVVDPGPYLGHGVTEAGTIDWRRIAVPDVTWAGFKVREATKLGQRDAREFFFYARCPLPDCPSKGQPYEWGFAFDDLPQKPWPQATLDRIASGDLSLVDEVSLTEGVHEMHHRILTGADMERRSRKPKKGSQIGPLTEALMERITKVICPDGSEIGREDIDAWVADLDSIDIEDVIESLDHQMGGVVTTIEIDCIDLDCQHHYEVELPLDPKSGGTRKKASLSS